MKLPYSIFRLLALALAAMLTALGAMGCTSAIIGADATRHDRTILWKHRDTGHRHNFVERVAATDTSMAYVALFNAGDTTLREAWVGINEAGLAVMNTASYNLAPDTARVRDREGLVMSQALRSCRTVGEFEQMLRRMIATGRPLGVQANFGVADAEGSGAYIETSDHFMRVYPLDQAADGMLLRTNFSFSGGNRRRLGEARYADATALLAEPLSRREIEPATLTEGLSRSFFCSTDSTDYADGRHPLAPDTGDMISRRSSSASVAIELARPGEDPRESTVMWVALGFPAASHVEAVTLDSVPAQLRPTTAAGHSPLCDEVNRRLDRALTKSPLRSGVGKRKTENSNQPPQYHFDMRYLLPLMRSERQRSMEAYRRYRAEHP